MLNFPKHFCLIKKEGECSSSPAWYWTRRPLVGHHFPRQLLTEESNKVFVIFNVFINIVTSLWPEWIVGPYYNKRWVFFLFFNLSLGSEDKSKKDRHMAPKKWSFFITHTHTSSYIHKHMSSSYTYIHIHMSSSSSLSIYDNSSYNVVFVNIVVIEIK